jgi:glucan-binding YG repeat protein
MILICVLFLSTIIHLKAYAAYPNKTEISSEGTHVVSGSIDAAEILNINETYQFIIAASNFTLTNYSNVSVAGTAISGTAPYQLAAGYYNIYRANNINLNKCLKLTVPDIVTVQDNVCLVNNEAYLQIGNDSYVYITLYLSVPFLINGSADGVNYSSANSRYECTKNISSDIVVTVPHVHDFTYSSAGATITATCTADGCSLPPTTASDSDHVAKLILVKPTMTTYGQSGEGISEAATLTGLSDFNTATGKNVAVTDIKYVGRAGTNYDESTTAPTDAGKYTAKITVENNTASVDYEIATTYPLWVGGVQVTSANASNIGGSNKASYNADTNTLTLKGVSIDTAHSSAGIYYKNNDTPNKPLNVILKGANSIGGSGISTGIYGDGYYGSFTFSGEGSLNTTGTSIGIGTYKGSVEIDSGTINARGTDSSGIYVYGGIVINGGNVEATGANFGIQSMYGVRISDGTVTAEATNSTENTGAAIYDGSSNNGISITGGTVTANGTSSNGKAHGLYLGSSGAITIGADITSLTVTGKTSASVGKVENSIVGMGWNTVDGTGDGTEIAVNTSGESLSAYKKLLFPYKKPAANVKTAPTAKSDLIYNGSAQELITPGDKGEGAKEIQYALGTDSSTAPKEGWRTSIPTATDAGTYYVWYKAIGDESHSDSDANYVKVTIDEKTEAHTHDIKHVEAKEPTCTEDGYEAHYECTICHEWYADDTGSVPLDKNEITKKATGHKWDDGVITQEATYDETGIKTYICSVCGETKVETIPVKIRRSSSSSDSSDSDSESSGGGSNGKSGSISTKSIDVNGNTVQTQPDSGAPLSDRGGNWGNQEHIWTYTKSDGSLAKGEWLNLEYDGHTYWYYFDDSTIMQTNWFDYNGSRYFLVPEMDGWRGRMATGWHMVDNKWYYFEPTIGANQGILYRGMTTPDGHTVGADGAWDGNGTTPIGAIHTGTTVTMN